MIENNKKPLAHVEYMCDCGTIQKFFELYTPEHKSDTKFCYFCRKITKHKRILPSDDKDKNYQRPSLFK
ncbi:MAG: hypothetical protein KGI58_02920 [Patescibacteria group bacterium]|nr:hypothetical protein [Patescibacteria group bacterium]